MNGFVRLENGHADRNYVCLKYRMNILIRNQLAEKNKTDVVTAHMKRAKGVTPGFDDFEKALAVESVGEGGDKRRKGKGKGTGKKKGSRLGNLAMTYPGGQAALDR